MFFVKRFLLCALLWNVCACAAATPTAAPAASPTPSFVSAPTLVALPTSQFIEATPNVPPVLRGTFVYGAGDGSLWLQQASGGDAMPFVARSTESIAQMPAFSPDGKSVAFAALLFLADGNLRGDIRLMDGDGKNVRTLLRAQANDEVYWYPRFARDGRMLVTHVRNSQMTNERAALEWLDVSSGKTTRVIDDARDGDVAREGKWIAFVRYDVTTMRSSLWLANADGMNAQPLVDDKTFNAILNPRFSPDGKWLAFSVHGAPQKNLPQASREQCGLSILVFCLAQTAHAHSAPGALWRVNLETKTFQQLTDIYDDSPTPAWSSDGAYIAIHDFTGIRLIDLARQEIYPLFLENGGSGGFDWQRTGNR